MVLGIEASAIVEEIGSGVGDLRVGDHVVTVFRCELRGCEPCVRGRPALCEPAPRQQQFGTLISGRRGLHRRGPTSTTTLAFRIC